MPPRHNQRRSRRRKKPWYKSRLNIWICCALLLEVILFQIYYWDYIVSVINSSAVLVANTVINVPIVHEMIIGGGNNNGTTNITEVLEFTSKAVGYYPFPPLEVIRERHNYTASYIRNKAQDVNASIQVLNKMGVHSQELTDELIELLPPWSQILDNFGPEPVILGLERCKAYRKRVRPRDRSLGPAGLFSTGTNVLQSLMVENCLPASQQQMNKRRFNNWQVPWGKHNPAGARLHHIAQLQRGNNQSASLPIVTVRHPYTWLYAMCHHSYSLTWEHSKEFCDRNLSLQHKVRAAYGAARPGTNRNIPLFYESLMHAWRDWNWSYFNQRDYPLLMIRLEDLVYRPKQVVAKVCECAGGRLAENFKYQQDSANYGKGHGDHRSDLLSAFVKYGQPISLYPNNKYSHKDWKVIHRVLNDDHDMMAAFGYKV